MSKYSEKLERRAREAAAHPPVADVGVAKPEPCPSSFTAFNEKLPKLREIISDIGAKVCTASFLLVKMSEASHCGILRNEVYALSGIVGCMDQKQAQAISRLDNLEMKLALLRGMEGGAK